MNAGSRGTFLRRSGILLWYTSILISSVGVVAIGVGAVTNGIIAVVAGGGALSLLSLATEFRVALEADEDQVVKFSIVTTGAMVFVTAVAITLNVFSTDIQLFTRIVTLTLGLQALLLTVGGRPAGTTRSGRLILLALSHGAVFVGSFLILPVGTQHEEAALLAYSVGFSFLILHSFWMRRLRSDVSPPQPETRRRYWESLLIIAILAEILAVLGLTITPQGAGLNSSLDTFLVVIAGISGVVMLGALSVPRSPPNALEAITGPAETIAQHVLTMVLLVNTLLLAFFAAFPRTFVWTTAVFLSVLSVGVVMNYLMLLRAYVQSPSESSPPQSLITETPLTIVISAMNEANVLRETLPDNLEELPDVEFLIVPAAASSDETHAVLAGIRDEYGDQVRIREGTGGSKAGDLNQIWPYIDTPFALLLDADERISRDSVALALKTILSDPALGVVQGRKIAARPDATALSRFVSIERQHSTWIDHPFMNDVLRAGHFAGSAALLRRSVVSDVDGFETSALTEDIDLTLRLYLETDWEIDYVPEVVVREYNPGTWMSLVRQRERWGRGWAQTAVRHLPRVLRNARELGWRRTVGLSWELFLAVSSPLYTVFPAIIVYWAVSGGAPFPALVTLPLAVLMLPERGLSFLYAGFEDPSLSRDTRRGQLVVGVVHAYIWIIFGWIIQLHSLYLQLAGAVGRWEVTEKTVDTDETPDRLNTEYRD